MPDAKFQSHKREQESVFCAELGVTYCHIVVLKMINSTLSVFSCRGLTLWLLEIFLNSLIEKAKEGYNNFKNHHKIGVVSIA